MRVAIWTLLCSAALAARADVAADRAALLLAGVETLPQVGGVPGLSRRCSAPRLLAVLTGDEGETPRRWSRRPGTGRGRRGRLRPRRGYPGDRGLRDPGADGCC
ncbi:MAG: hypothetical protein R3F62_05615 [Planctomycetota bacterium]